MKKILTRGRDIDQIEVYGRADASSNPRLSILQELGYDIESLRQLLDSNDSRRFETGIAFMFHPLS